MPEPPPLKTLISAGQVVRPRYLGEKTKTKTGITNIHLWFKKITELLDTTF